MRRWLSIFVAFNLIYGHIPCQAETPPAQGAQPVIAVTLPESANGPAGTLVISEVSREQEPGVVNQLSSSGQVVFLTAETGDPVNKQLDGRTNVIISADRPEEMPLFSGAEGKAALEKMRPIVEHHKLSMSRIAPALLIALVPAVGYGAYFWYFSSQFMQGAGAFGWEFMVAAGIGVFTNHWLKFSRSVGELTNAGAMLLASKFGRVFSPLAQKRWKRCGQILTAYGLNLISAFALMGIGNRLGDWHGDAFAFLFAIFASNEIVDFHSERYFKEQHLPAAVWIRQAAFALTELLSLSGVHGAEIFAGTAVSLAVLSFILKEETDQVTSFIPRMYNAVKGSLSEKKQSLFSSLSKFGETQMSRIRRLLESSNPALAKTNHCEDLLAKKDLKSAS